MCVYGVVRVDIHFKKEKYFNGNKSKELLNIDERRRVKIFFNPHIEKAMYFMPKDYAL